ncbi:MAG: hypothetical protein PHH82_04400 [Candidatus ainarchaeum sp.]|nr:hypothetical protein [Candidatus ainarchaeum sp.]
MSYPKVEFKIVPIKKEIWAFNHFLQHSNQSFKFRFLDSYSILKEPKLDITGWLKGEWKTKRRKTKVNVGHYQKEWNKIQKEFMTNLSDVIGTPWFKNPEKIEAYLSLCKVFPRNIEKMNFYIPYDWPTQRVFGIAAHEITHLLYFKKFGELFPDVSKQKYGGPHIEWILSEILVSVILNDKKFNKILPGPHYSYDCFYKNRIGKRTIQHYFEDKYAEDIYKKGKTFDDYLKWAYKFAKKHEKELDVVK